VDELHVKTHVQVRHRWLRAVILATWESEIGRIMAGDPISKTNQSKMHCRCSSSRRAPAGSPEFKPSPIIKKKKVHVQSRKIYNCTILEI
jgi:hypothetical protein